VRGGLLRRAPGRKRACVGNPRHVGGALAAARTMTTVAGVFQSFRLAAGAAEELRRAGIENVHLIAPGDAEGLNTVPTTPTEQPGMGRAVGGVVGAGVGIAGGFEIGTALASLILPGVGTVMASGIVAATLLGA